MTAQVLVQQVLLKRGNTAVASNYTGPVGEVVIDTDLHSLRVQDATTRGGHIIATTEAIPVLVTDFLANLEPRLTANIRSNVAGLLGDITFDGSTISSTYGLLDIVDNVVTVIGSGPTDGAGIFLNWPTDPSSIQFVTLPPDNQGYPNYWYFDTHGNIILPAGGDILDSDGNSVLGGAGAGDRLISGNSQVVLDEYGVLTLPNGGKISPQDVEGIDLVSPTDPNGYIALTSYDYHNWMWVDPGGAYIEASNGYRPAIWSFENTGTIRVPLRFPVSFTAVLDGDHCTTNPGLSLTGPAWEFNLQWQCNPNGEVELLADNGPLPSLVAGYADDQSFDFTEADHGIPGYTLTITLSNVAYPGGAGWTADLNFSAPPVYPPAVHSAGAIKLSSSGQAWTFGTDGNLVLPAGGDIVDSTGASVLGGGSESYFGTVDKFFTVQSTYIISTVDIGTNSFTVVGNAVGDIMTHHHINIDAFFAIQYQLPLAQPPIYDSGTGLTTVVIDDTDSDFVNNAWPGYKLRCIDRYYQQQQIGFTEAFTFDNEGGNVVGLKPINTLVNGSKTVTLDSAGVLSLPEVVAVGAGVIQPAGNGYNLKLISNGNIWNFDTDGNLILPGTSVISNNGLDVGITGGSPLDPLNGAGGRIRLAGADAGDIGGDITLQGGNSPMGVGGTISIIGGAGLNPGQVQLVSNDYSWAFQDDGSIRLPNNTTIGNVVSNLTQGPAVNSEGSAQYYGHFADLDYSEPNGVRQGWIVNGPGLVNVVIDGVDGYTQYVTIPNSGGPKFLPGESYTFTGPLVSTGSKITVNEHDWKFTIDGTLNIPGDIGGDSYLSLWAPTVATYTNSTWINMDDPGNNLTNTIQLVTNRNYGQHRWNFDGSGKLTVPGAIKSRVTSPSTQGWRMEFRVPDAVYGNPSLYTYSWSASNNGDFFAELFAHDLTQAVFEVVEDGTVITTAHNTGAGGDVANTIVLSFDVSLDYNSNCVIRATSNDYVPAVYAKLGLRAGDAQANFDQYGTLTVPGDVTITGTFENTTDGYLNLRGDNVGATSRIHLRNMNGDPSSDINIHLQTGTGGNVFEVFQLGGGNTTYPYAGGLRANGATSPILIQTDTADSNNTWVFDVDGSLTVPGDIKSAAGIGDVVIEANNGSTARTWTFGSNGLLTLPVLDAAPTGAAGAVAMCSGSGWDGGGDGLQHLMVYINGAWTKVV